MLLAADAGVSNEEIAAGVEVRGSTVICLRAVHASPESTAYDIRHLSDLL